MMTEEQFHKWYDQYYDEVYQFLVYLHDNQRVAEDQIHEVFVQLSAAQVATANERAYMYRHAYQEVAKAERKKRFHKGKKGTLATSNPSLRQFYDIFRELTLIERAVLYLHMHKHFTVKEIAFIVGESTDGVKEISLRAVDTLERQAPKEEKMQWVRQSMKHLPPYVDSRNRHTIYQRLLDDPRVTNTVKKEVKAKGPRWFTFLIMIALIIVLPLLYDKWQESKEDDKVQEEQKQPEEVVEEEIPKEEEKEKQEQPFNERALIGRYALYEADLKQNVPFTLGLVSEDALSVPVSILLPKSRVIDDLKTPTPSTVALYEQYAALIDEEALGFTEYHPFHASFRTKEAAIYMTLAADHQYDQSSATIEIFNDTLQQTFYGFREVRLLNEKNEPVTFNGIGEINDPVSLYSGMNGYAYYAYPYGSRYYLAPSFGQTYVTVEEAFEALKSAENDFYLSIVPKDVTYTMEKSDQLITITFEEPFVIRDYEEEEVYRLLEGMNLTAASFGYSLKLEGIDKRGWKKFDFNRPLPKPVSANPIFATMYDEPKEQPTSTDES